jgi:tetratricopeptide (TPR) repeat protein
LSRFYRDMKRMVVVGRRIGTAKYEDAIRILGEMHREDPSDAGTAFLIGMCHEWSERPGEARVWVERALAADPRHFDSLRFMTRRHYAEGRMDEARAYAMRALEAARDRPDASIPKPLAVLFRALVKLRIAHPAKTQAVIDGERDDRAWIDWAREFVRER